MLVYYIDDMMGIRPSEQEPATTLNIFVRPRVTEDGKYSLQKFRGLPPQ